MGCTMQERQIVPALPNPVLKGHAKNDWHGRVNWIAPIQWAVSLMMVLLRPFKRLFADKSHMERVAIVIVAGCWLALVWATIFTLAVLYL